MRCVNRDPSGELCQVSLPAHLADAIFANAYISKTESRHAGVSRRAVFGVNRSFEGGKMKKHLRAALLAGLAVLCIVSSVSAQENTADILGTVSDAGGAVVVNAKVTVQNLATNDVKTATTNAAGDFVFNLLPSGQYTVTVEM